MWICISHFGRRLFQWFLYTLFIYNAVLGVVVAIARLLLSALFGLLLLIRLDRVVLMKGFEFWDLGEFVSSCTNDGPASGWTSAIYMLLARVHVHNLKIVRSAVNSQMLLIAPTGVA